ncbi:MAG: GNAT family N-acetyltransferase [Coxiella sp. (in: Bacteria)]|nr:MAG: GNAT family N-acetyltransferase [Coxiella sp. (in: g-proteobacteria)]
MELVYKWLEEQHVREFWDNSQAHRDDIKVFAEGRKVSSSYFNGIFDYWLGFVDGVPHALFLTSCYKSGEHLPELHRQYIAKDESTYGIDYCIGNISYFGTGHGSPTLLAFTDFFYKINDNVSSFLIDPDESNPRAIHVYEKAGFKRVGLFVMEEGVFKGQASVLMVKSDL